jgi:hypothetical protein
MTSKEIAQIYAVWQKESRKKSTYKPTKVLEAKGVKR